MDKLIILILVTLFFYSCQSQQGKITKKEYPSWIGSAKTNLEIDDDSFKICNSENKVIQYFNNSKGFEYYGEKFSIIKEFKKFIPSQKENQNGIVRIRFIVNCKGETGRFRILEADNNYNEFHFDSEITKQLLKITKNLKGWVVKERKNKDIDYYQYFIFKIKNGNINEILP